MIYNNHVDNSVKNIERMLEMTKETIDIRREEIINACEKLYENNSFKNIYNKKALEQKQHFRVLLYIIIFKTKEENIF